MEARIIVALEVSGGLLSEFRQLGPAIEPRPCTTASAGAAGVGRPLAGLVLIHLGERHQPAAGTTRVHHNDLFGRPLACDIGLAGWTTRRPVGVRTNDRPPDFLQTAFRRLHVLAIAIHTGSVGEKDRLQVARVGICPVRRRLDGDLLANRQQVCRPAGAPQDVHRPHFTPMMADLPVVVGDIEVKPRVWIDQIDTRKPGLELDRLVEGVLCSTVMRESKLGQKECDNKCYGSKHDRTPVCTPTLRIARRVP